MSAAEILEGIRAWVEGALAELWNSVAGRLQPETDEDQ